MAGSLGAQQVPHGSMVRSGCHKRAHLTRLLLTQYVQVVNKLWPNTPAGQPVLLPTLR